MKILTVSYILNFHLKKTFKKPEKNQNSFVKEFVIQKPNVYIIDSIISRVVCVCGYKYIHSLDKQFHIYDLNFTDNKINKTGNIILTGVEGGRLPLLMKNEKTIIESQYKYKLNAIKKITIKVPGDISDLNICYYLKLQLPMSAIERLFYKKKAINDEYINTYCYGYYIKISNNCIRWFLYNKSKNAIDYEDLCFQFDANVEYCDDV